MALEDLRATAENEIRALRSDLGRISERLGHEDSPTVGSVLKAAIQAKLAGLSAPSNILEPGNVLLLDHRDRFCWIIREAEKEGHRPEIEEFVYAELEHA